MEEFWNQQHSFQNWQAMKTAWMNWGEALQSGRWPRTQWWICQSASVPLWKEENLPEWQASLDHHAIARKEVKINAATDRDILEKNLIQSILTSNWDRSFFSRTTTQSHDQDRKGEVSESPCECHGGAKPESKLGIILKKTWGSNGCQMWPNKVLRKGCKFLYKSFFLNMQKTKLFSPCFDKVLVCRILRK